MRQSQEGRALRQFTLSTGKSAGRNSSGRITVFHRGHGMSNFLVRISLFLCVLAICCYVSLIMGFVDLFHAMLGNLGARALSFFLIKMGCPGGLALAIGFLVRGIFNSESAPFLGNFMDTDSGPSTSFPKLEWELALELPDSQVAPECLRSHVKQELKYLLHIGRKNTLSDTMFNNWIDPLAVDKSSVGFCKALLDRIAKLKLEHYNKGNHIPFKFSTKEEKERLYSIIWEYADKLPPE